MHSSGHTLYLRRSTALLSPTEQSPPAPFGCSTAFVSVAMASGNKVLVETPGHEAALVLGHPSRPSTDVHLVLERATPLWLLGRHLSLVQGS